MKCTRTAEMSRLAAEHGSAGAGKLSNRQPAPTGHRVPVMRSRSAFTLLELLMVVAMLAIVAGGSLMMFGDSEDDAAEQISLSEIQQIKKALLQFERDTGRLPKQGPFNLDSQPGGAVPLSNLPAYVLPGQEFAWFYSPANFWQLYGRWRSLKNPIRTKR